MDKHLHIVTHDVPWPADNGGVIDIYCTLRSLHARGVNIHLHCFTKGRAPQPELEKYCRTVQYYPRKKNSRSFSLQVPVMVNSRTNDALLANLQKDDHPVLLEGIQCSYYFYKGWLEGRKAVIRLFNTEYLYYQQLAVHEKNLLKKLYYLHESRLLKKYEKAIASRALLLALSGQDAVIYREVFNAADVHHLPPILPYTMALGKAGKGSYCLYHGNLAINENEKAASWLLEEVFSKLNIPFVIAGNGPSKKLEHLAHKHLHTCLVANPSEKEMQDMIAKAHIHVLPSFNKTGIKLKLLNAFFNGRHCLVNHAAVAGSGLEDYCEQAEDAVAFRQKIETLFEKPFSEDEAQRRQGVLQTMYDNEANTKALMTFLW